MLGFQIIAPMVAWGDHWAGGKERPSSVFPSRSAVLGLIGAAKGLRRSDTSELERLRETTKLAFAMHGSPRLTEDYRTYTAAKGKYASRAEAIRGNTLTVETFRWHVEQVAYRVFLASDAESDIHAALIKPHFGLYFGRREFPAGPLRPRILECSGLEDALEEFDLEGQGWWFEKLKAGPLKLAWEEGFPGAPQETDITVRRDEPLSFEDRTFMERREWRA
jgi:CRISPR system Cascade subunit CasD